jgi:hypothetical protein
VHLVGTPAAFVGVFYRFSTKTYNRFLTLFLGFFSIFSLKIDFFSIFLLKKGSKFKQLFFLKKAFFEKNLNFFSRNIYLKKFENEIFTFFFKKLRIFFKIYFIKILAKNRRVFELSLQGAAKKIVRP